MANEAYIVDEIIKIEGSFSDPFCYPDDSQIKRLEELYKILDRELSEDEKKLINKEKIRRKERFEEKRYLFLGYLSYFTIFLVPFWLFLKKDRKFSKPFSKQISFIKKATIFNFCFLSVMILIVNLEPINTQSIIFKTALFFPFIIIHFILIFRSLIQFVEDDKNYKNKAS